MKFNIESESIFNGNSVPELSIPVPVITTQVDESSILNKPMHFIVCIGADRFGKIP